MPIGASDAHNFSVVKGPNGSIPRGLINRYWSALSELSWHSKQTNTLMSMQEHLPLISLHCADQIEIGRDLVHLLWSFISNGTSLSSWMWFSCYSRWLLPPRWLGVAVGR